MKLYYSPFACSLAAHIALREAGVAFSLHRVDLTTKGVEGGGDLFAQNPMGQVPTIVTDEGRVVSENAAVLTYVADLAPVRGLAPAPDAFERYELVRFISLVGTEIHKKGLAAIYAPDTSEEVKAYARASLARPLAVLERELAGRDTLLGGAFTVADAYLFWALTLMPHARVSLEAFPAVVAYQARHLERPAVAAALAVEREARARPFAA